MGVALYGKLKDITRTSHHVNLCWEVYLCSMNKGLEGEILNMLIQLHLASVQDRELCVEFKNACCAYFTAFAYNTIST